MEIDVYRRKLECIVKNIWYLSYTKWRAFGMGEGSRILKLWIFKRQDLWTYTCKSKRRLLRKTVNANDWNQRWCPTAQSNSTFINMSSNIKIYFEENAPDVESLLLISFLIATCDQVYYNISHLKRHNYDCYEMIKKQKRKTWEITEANKNFSRSQHYFSKKRLDK